MEKMAHPTIIESQKKLRDKIFPKQPVSKDRCTCVKPVKAYMRQNYGKCARCLKIIDSGDV